jgi:hypothetical protein
MERERWEELYRLACVLGKDYRAGICFSVAMIVGVYAWAVIHDRPVSWACVAKNWPNGLPWRRLPSQSTMSRRLRSKPVELLLKAIEESLHQQSTSHWFKTMDSKPLTVGAASKDAEAKWGRGVKRKPAKGYKLHVIEDGCAVPGVWCVLPMNVHDSKAAKILIPQLKGSGYLTGDSIYDMNNLYDLAGSHHHQLVAPRQKPQSKGLGHIRHSPYRLRSLELQQGLFGKALIHERGTIERSFGVLTCFGGGLGPLPAWVRGLFRVVLWVKTKLIINGLRLIRLNQRTIAIA